jgi:hypothetical protein
MVTVRDSLLGICHQLGYIPVETIQPTTPRPRWEHPKVTCFGDRPLRAKEGWQGIMVEKRDSGRESSR